MSKPAVVRIEPRAARYLQLLVEFGHLDPISMEDAVMAASELYPDRTSPIPLAAVKRVAATMLASPEAPSGQGKDILSADWPLLFY